jgi:putative ABC transport system permease protein
MNWLTLSLKEWQRRPLRTSLTAAGVAIAVAALFSLLSFQDGYKRGVQRELDRLGAHVLVVPKGCPYDAASIALHGASWPCYLKARYLDEVRATPGVATAAPALMSAFYDQNGRQTVYVGIETNMLAVKRNWHIAGTWPQQPGQVLAGNEVASRLQWKVGQEVQLPGLKQATGFVSGILLPTRGPDDSFVFLRLADAQGWLHRPAQLTHILVRLADPNDLDRVVQQLRGCDAGLFMNVVPLAHLFQTIQGVVNSTRVLLGCVALVALFAAGAGVSNTVLMAIVERTREIGVLRALGASRHQIFGLFWLETLQVCLAGAVIGVIVAFGAAGGLEHWLRARLPFAPTEPLLQWHGWVAAACLACAFGLGSLAGFLPAWRAAWLPPVVAMRRGEGSL